MNASKQVTTNKNIEIETLRNPWCWFKIRIEITRKTDHAGLLIQLCLFQGEFSFRFYDGRHWDYEKDQWQTYEENTEENK